LSEELLKSRILEISNLYKGFPGVQALEAIDFDLYAGEIHGLVGENGAGKSTLVEILAGNYRSDSGAIRMGDEELGFLSPSKALSLGIETVHQEDQLAPSITAAENIYMGNLPKNRIGLFNLQKCIEDSQKLVESLGLHLDVSQLITKFSPVEKKTVCIAKALSRKVRILIFDEPTATLGVDETKLLLQVVRTIRGQGIGIIYISHFINEVFEIADRITVFKDGRRVATHKVGETDKEQVIGEMVGRKAGHIYVRPDHKVGDVIFKVHNLTRKDVLEDVSFEIREGEIFGIGGLIGSGRTELARLMFGLDKRDSGKITHRGKEVTPDSPMRAIRNGFGYLTEDRKETGLILGRPVKENITIAEMTMRKPVFLDLPEEKKAASKMVSTLRIMTPSLDQVVVNLSGGNQQKVVLAKWLLSNVDIIIFDEPTIGIDVGAKKEIYILMNEMSEKGKVIIMISSDLPELISMSDRIGIMRRGKLERIIDSKTATEETVLKLATGLGDT
jgi:ribose transport system ATP-binding protein